MNDKQQQSAALLRAIADGLDDGMPEVHSVSGIGWRDPVVQVSGDGIAGLNRWLARFDPAARAEQTGEPYGGSGGMWQQNYAGTVTVAGKTVKFHTGVRVTISVTPEGGA